jgi:hypothetical protein
LVWPFSSRILFFISSIAVSKKNSGIHINVGDFGTGHVTDPSVRGRTQDYSSVGQREGKKKLAKHPNRIEKEL